jgi:zinc D-Ala-D-Ala dipeptidase
MHTVIILTVLLYAITIMAHSHEHSHAHSLPEKFVYLVDIDPTIIQSLRYFTSENFLGRPQIGYNASKAILTKEAANALANVQIELQSQGYGLVVYDAYRPQRVLDSWMEWLKEPVDVTRKAEYYPHVNKSELVPLGYLDAKSGHSRGSTVDLTMIRQGQTVKPIERTKRTLLNGKEYLFLDDGTVDMGSSFDLLDEVSHHNTSLVDGEALKNRNLLHDVMVKSGFKPYLKEWWHYTLVDEPFPETYFDFDIE